MMAPVPGRKPTPPKRTVEPEFTIRSLDQLKVLSDPLRVRIVEALCVERTTKQVAETIGEPPTKLYHHVDMLEKAGLIRRTRTRRNRGTLEKYYLAAARTFRADSSIFTGATSQSETDAVLGETVTSFLRGTEDGLRRVIAAGHGGDALASRGVLSYLEVRGNAAQMAAIRARVEEFLRTISDDTDDDTPPDELERYRLTLAFFPLVDG
jgi:DNA-binding transcriptional ArsR family regulator